MVGETSSVTPTDGLSKSSFGPFSAAMAGCGPNVNVQDLDNDMQVDFESRKAIEFAELTQDVLNLQAEFEKLS